MASENIVNVSVSDFEKEVVNSDVPVMVDFWATWCGPCRMVLPIMDQLADEYKGKAKICEVNVDEESELAAKFGVMTIPTIIVFKDGEIKDQVSGAYPKSHFEDMLNKVL